MSFDELIAKGRRALEEDDSRSALQTLQEAIKLGETAEAWQLLAEAQLEENQLAQAKRSLTSGLKIDADNIDLLYLSADLSLEEEQIDAALQTYEKIIAIDPQESDALVNKALLEMDAEQFTAA
ncbi:MAG: tetratricopeptide repeat protein, partial [Chloroflexi bacterium]|nr:tetratricopeptide repeat protein [Chloroflexota bacterium]